MYHWKSIAGILMCLVCLLSACGSQPSTVAEPSQPEDKEEKIPEQVATDTAPVSPSATPTEAPPTMPAEALESPLPTATVTTRLPAEGEDTRPLSPLPLPVQPGPTGEGGTVRGEVPEDLLESILEDLQERKGMGREEITIERAEAVVWRDGSLGCPQPGMMYIQVLMPGYLVVLQVRDDVYNYHAGESGHFLLCERSLPGEVLPPADGAGPLLEQ
jgi:hypothetical protein